MPLGLFSAMAPAAAGHGLSVTASHTFESGSGSSDEASFHLALEESSVWMGLVGTSSDFWKVQRLD